MEACFRRQIQAPHGCESLGALEYPVECIEGPDYEDQLGARDDSPHPHHALRQLKDMGNGTYVLLPTSRACNECAVRAGGRVEARFCPRIQAPHGCEPFRALKYPIGWIEDQITRTNTEGGNVKWLISVQSPIDVDQTAILRT